MSARILLVEDDELIGTMVEMNLARHGHAVTWERTGEDALARLEQSRFDLLVLDLMLPRMDGLEVAAEVRRRDLGTPVLMLTARDETATKVDALETGADDYLTKPFDMDELLARIRALIRRARSSVELPAAEHMAVAGGRLDLDGLRFVARSGRSHELTAREAAVLALFARNPGRTLSRADVLDEAWGMDATPPERTVDNFVLRLRRVIEDDPGRPRRLVTVRGRGYRYDP